jgi:hypothetical protein
LRTAWSCIWLLILLAGAPRALRADNPRVSVQLENATVAEAAAALTRAAGIPVELDPALAGAPAAAALAAKGRFSWKNVSFGDALRDLCERCGLRPDRRTGGYLLMERDPRRWFWRPEVVVPPLNVRVFTRRLSLDPVGMLKVDGEGVWVQNPLRLHLACALPDGDPESLAGIENLAAQDDMGNLLVSGDERAVESGYSAAFPDEWSGVALLSPPAPGSRRLVWITGDLVAYRDYQRYRLELPVGKDVPPARAEAGKAVVEVRRFGRVVEEGERVGAAAPGEARAVFFLELRVQVPTGEPVIVGDERTPPVPLLLTESGQPVKPVTCGVARNPAPDFTTYTIHAAYPDPGAPPARVALTLVRRAQPEKLLSFRLEDVRLPPEARVSVRSGGVDAGGAHPFFARGGGSLLTRVLIRDQPAVHGSLLLGLSAKNGAEWSACRWVLVDLEGDGSARLEDVAPGTYRVRRVYRPDSAAEVAGMGRWQNGDVEIEVSAAKAAASPPLRWVPTARR